MEGVGGRAFNGHGNLFSFNTFSEQTKSDLAQLIYRYKDIIHLIKSIQLVN